MKKYFTTKKLAITGLFTALVTVVTLIIRIPLVGTAGYFNIGDAIIFIMSALIGPVPAMFAGGIGSAIADLIGYPIWAPFTLIIKGLEGLFCGLIIKNFAKSNYKYAIQVIVGFFAMLISVICMVTMYFFAGWILSGLSGAIGSILGTALQGTVSLIIAMIVVYAVNLRKIVGKYLD